MLQLQLRLQCHHVVVKNFLIFIFLKMALNQLVPVRLDWVQVLTLKGVTDSQVPSLQTVLLRAPGHHLYKYQMNLGNGTLVSINLIDAGLPNSVLWGPMASSSTNSSSPGNITVVLSSLSELTLLKDIHTNSPTYQQIPYPAGVTNVTNVVINSRGNKIFLLYGNSVGVLYTPDLDYRTAVFSSFTITPPPNERLDFFGCSYDGQYFFVGGIGGSVWIFNNTIPSSITQQAYNNFAVVPSGMAMNSAHTVFVTDSANDGYILSLDQNRNTGRSTESSTNGWQGISWNYGNPIAWKIMNVKGIINTYFRNMDGVQFGRSFLIGIFEKVFSVSTNILFNYTIVGRQAADGITFIHHTLRNYNVDNDMARLGLDPTIGIWTSVGGYYRQNFFALTNEKGIRKFTPATGFGDVEGTGGVVFTPILIANYQDDTVALGKSPPNSNSIYYRNPASDPLQRWVPYPELPQLNIGFLMITSAGYLIAVSSSGIIYYRDLRSMTGSWKFFITTNTWKQYSSTSSLLYLLTGTQSIFQFDVYTVPPSLNSVPITGLSPEEEIRSIAFKDSSAYIITSDSLYSVATGAAIKQTLNLEAGEKLNSLSQVVISSSRAYVFGRTNVGNKVWADNGNNIFIQMTVKYNTPLTGVMNNPIVDSNTLNILVPVTGQHILSNDPTLSPNLPIPIPEPIRPHEERDNWILPVILIVIVLILLFVMCRRR